MKVQQMITASADVLTITRLAPGNVYKRVETGYQGESTLRFGVVQDVMNNGTDAAVTALEYQADYNAGIIAVMKVFTGAQPAAIYPAQPEEIRNHLHDLQARAAGAIADAEDKVAKAIRIRDAVDAVVAQVGALSAPEVTSDSPHDAS